MSLRIGAGHFTRLLFHSVRSLFTDDGFTHAAAIAYFTIFSIFPLLLLLIAILGHFLSGVSSHQAVTTLVESYVPPVARQIVMEALPSSAGSRGALSFLSAIGLLWSATLMFDAINVALNTAWGTRSSQHFFAIKLRSLSILLLVTVLSAVSIVIATHEALRPDFASLFQSVPLWEGPHPSVPGASTIGRVLSPALKFASLALAYKLLPRARVLWRDALLGAFLAVVLWEAVKRGLLSYVTDISRYRYIYGSFSAVLVLLLWTYISALILIWGAEVGSASSRMRSGSAGA